MAFVYSMKPFTVPTFLFLLSILYKFTASIEPRKQNNNDNNDDDGGGGGGGGGDNMHLLCNRRKNSVLRERLQIRRNGIKKKVHFRGKEGLK